MAGAPPDATPLPAPTPMGDATPTRVDAALEPLQTRAATLPPMPDAPDSGVLAYARYFFSAVHARYRRGAAVRALETEIQREVAKLDGVLGELGRAARAAKLDGRALADENKAIDEASARAEKAQQGRADLARRLADEKARYDEVAADLATKLGVAEKETAEADAALDGLEAERARTRERKKEVDRRQKGYLKGAEDREAQAGKAESPESRGALRRSAEDLRGDAARLEPERVELARLVTELDEKVKGADARVAAARAALDAIKKAVEDAGAGHRHRRAELQTDDVRQSKAAGEAEAEIGRHLVTLGTLLNLNRVARGELDPLYRRIDALKQGIATRENSVERLESERRQVDRAAIIRGAAILGGALVIVIAVICVLVAVL